MLKYVAPLAAMLASASLASTLAQQNDPSWTFCTDANGNVIEDVDDFLQTAPLLPVLGWRLDRCLDVPYDNPNPVPIPTGGFTGLPPGTIPPGSTEIHGVWIQEINAFCEKAPCPANPGDPVTYETLDDDTYWELSFVTDVNVRDRFSHPSVNLKALYPHTIGRYKKTGKSVVVLLQDETDLQEVADFFDDGIPFQRKDGSTGFRLPDDSAGGGSEEPEAKLNCFNIKISSGGFPLSTEAPDGWPTFLGEAKPDPPLEREVEATWWTCF